MRFRLIIFLTLSCIAVLPVIALATWIATDALDRENEIIRNKHLVIAKNVGEALERYSVDLTNGFELIAKLQPPYQELPAVSEFMLGLNFIHFCIADLNTGIVLTTVASKELPCPKQVPPGRFKKFVDLLKEGQVVFSPVMSNPWGNPTLYMLRAYGDKLVIGAVSTQYIVNQGKAVTFGEKGHAAIVDQTGQVIAHPLPEWRKTIKNIAKVAPVQRMMAKETGVMTFYSPALKADMVAGYTFVSTTQWGVMIPQPIAEVRSAAKAVQQSALAISFAGITAAAVLSWFLSGYLTQALSRVIQTSKRMAEGDLDARVEMETGLRPREINELGLAFNSMADAIKARDSKLEAGGRILEETNLKLEESGEDLKFALANAKKANLAKSEFLSTMSHELRTPLNAIIGFSASIKDQAYGTLDDDRYLECLDDIHLSGQHLLELINDILDVSAIEAGAMELHEDHVILSDVVDVSVRLIRPRAEKGQVRVSCSLDHEFPLIYADNRRLKQIFLNLLSNAVKFTPQGGEVAVTARLNDDGSIAITVSDTGIGMEEEEVEKALSSFGQVDSGHDRHHEGTGLGLPLTQGLVKLHGGTLRVESTKGHGTDITVTFPKERIVQMV